MGNKCVDFKYFNINDMIAHGQTQLKCLKFLRRINKSKISTVWLASNEKLKTLCAVKITQKAKALQKKCIGLTINELDILHRINHPLIVNYIQGFQDLSNLYIVLQYMPYGSLRDYLNSYGNLTQSQTRFLIICLLTSVQYLHERQIAHLDIKPENLLIDEFGYFRLCDFNLSADQKKLTRGPSLKGVGTVGYQAPQVYQNQQLIGLESDLYSIGVMCVEMLTEFKKRKSHIFSPNQLKQKIRSSTDLSSTCIDFVQRLLQQNPASRIGANQNFNQIWKHPWINIDQSQKQEYIQKIVPSFIHDEYRKNFIQQSQGNVFSSNNSEHLEMNENMIKVSLKNRQFQKLFTKFKSI